MAVEEEELFEQRRKSSSLSSTAGDQSGGGTGRDSARVAARDRIKERLKRSSSTKESGRGGEGSPRSGRAETARDRVGARPGRVDDYRGGARRNEPGASQEQTSLREGGPSPGVSPEAADPPDGDAAEAHRREQRELRHKKKRHKEREGQKAELKSAVDGIDSKKGGNFSGEGGNVDSGKMFSGERGSNEERTGESKAESRKIRQAAGLGGLPEKAVELPARQRQDDEHLGHQARSSSAIFKNQNGRPPDSPRVTKQASEQVTDSLNGRDLGASTATERGVSERRRRERLGLVENSSSKQQSSSEGLASRRKEDSFSGASRRQDSFSEGLASRKQEFVSGSRQHDSISDHARKQDSFSESQGSRREERRGERELGPRRYKRPVFEESGGWTPNNAGTEEGSAEGNALSAFERAIGAFPEPQEVGAQHRDAQSEIEEVVRFTTEPQGNELALISDHNLLSSAGGMGSPSCTMIKQSARVSSVLSLWGGQADLTTLVYFPPWLPPGEPGVPAYLPEDDGLYIVQKPWAHARNRARMVNRLVSECRVRGPLQRWFMDGDVNQMRCLGDPLEKEMNRPARR
jgi:hypothetical protein